MFIPLAPRQDVLCAPMESVANYCFLKHHLRPSSNFVSAITPRFLAFRLCEKEAEISPLAFRDLASDVAVLGDTRSKPELRSPQVARGRASYTKVVYKIGRASR